MSPNSLNELPAHDSETGSWTLVPDTSSQNEFQGADPLYDDDSQHGDVVPRVYRHLTCGETTQLAEKIIQTNLIDPCFYNCFTYCSHCGNNWHQSDFVWVETRENLHAYQRRLYREKSGAYKSLYWATSFLGMAAIGAATGAVGGAFVGAADLLAGIGGMAGFVIGIGPARYLRLAILKTGLIEG